MMTNLDSDAFLVASADGKLDWILDSRSAYYLCRDRDMFSTHATCEGHVRMENHMANRVVGKRIIWFCMADGWSLTLTEVRYFPSLWKNLISNGMLDSKGYSFIAS